MAGVNNNLNLRLTIADFRAASNGTHNVGELMLEGGTLQIVNNHVWKTGQNNTILSADQNRAVREALYNALENDLGDEGAVFLAKAQSILLDGGNENQSLTRETVRLLCEGEESVKTADGDWEKRDRTTEFCGSIGGKLKSLSDRHITRPIKGLMRSPRDAAFRLTINERCDKLREHLRFYCGQSRQNDALRIRQEELNTLFFGTDVESAELARENPDLAKFRTWLKNFDAKATDSEGKVLSDKQALDKLFVLLAKDRDDHSTLSPAERDAEVRSMLNGLFDSKGAVGLAKKERLESLLFGNADPVDSKEEEIVSFRVWLSGKAPDVVEYSPDIDKGMMAAALRKQEEQQRVEKQGAGLLRELLMPLSEEIKVMSVKDRQTAVASALESCDGKGGYGQAMKARLIAILSGAENLDGLTDTEQRIAAFKGWVKDINTPMKDETGRLMSDEEASMQLQALLKKVGDEIEPVSQEDRQAAVDFALKSCDGKGGYGNAVKERLGAILSGSENLGELTDDEKKIAKFGEWVNSFEKAMKDETGKVMSDEEASAQLQALLKKVGDEIEPVSQDDRQAAVKKLLQDHFFSQGGVGQRDGRRLEMVFDKGIELKDLNEDEQVLAGFRDWANDFSAVAKGKEGRALSDSEALDLLTAQLEKMGAAIKPMSVADRQNAAQKDLDELFASKGDYGLAMKERLQTILLGESEPDPSSYENDIERELGTNFRQWLHNFNVIASNPDAVADDPEQVEAARSQPVDEERVFDDLLENVAKTPETSMLSDREGCRRLHELLAKASDGIAPMSVDDRKVAAEKMLQEKFFGEQAGDKAELGERLRAILQGTTEAVGDTEIGIAGFKGWLSDVNTMARGENDLLLSDESALKRLDALMETVSKSILSPAERKKRETLDAIQELLDGKEQVLDMFRSVYERTGDDLSGGYEKMDVAEARTLAWWQVKHQPDFEQVWSEAVDDANRALFRLLTPDADNIPEMSFDNEAADWESLDVDKAKAEFDRALTESLNAPIKELADVADKVRGYSTSDDMKVMEAKLQEDCGELLDEMGATDGEKAQVLAELPAEFRRCVYLCNESRGEGLSADAEPKVTLYNLIEGGVQGEAAVGKLFGEMKLWVRSQLADVRVSVARKRIQDRLQAGLQEGRKQALRKIVEAMPAFKNLMLTDEELERSVGGFSDLTLDGVSKDESVQKLLKELEAALNAKATDYVEKGAALPSELTQSAEGSDVVRQLTENIVRTLVDKFTGTKNVGAGTQIAAFANKIREARSAEFETEFEKSAELAELANTLTQGVVKRLAGLFEELLGGKNPDKGQLWLSAKGNPAKFDGDFAAELSSRIKASVRGSMSRIYVNCGDVTAEDVEQECERIFIATRDLLKGFGALYRNLAVDKKNYVSNLKVINRDVVVASTEGEVATVCAVMRREALSSLLSLLKDPNSYLNDAAKMKKEIFDAAVRVVDDGSVHRLWHTHQDESRNVKVREGLLEGLKG